MTTILKAAKTTDFPHAAIKKLVEGVGLTRQFAIASFAIMLAGLIGIGTWISIQIETSVLNHAATTTTLYVESFIAPSLQGLGNAKKLTQQQKDAIHYFLSDSKLGQRVIGFKLLGRNGKVLFSTNAAKTERDFEESDDITRAWGDELIARVSMINGSKDEDTPPKYYNQRLLEIHSPIHSNDSNQIIAVAEFYEVAAALEGEIHTAQWRSWVAVTVMMTAIYVLLAWFVRRDSQIISRQQHDLKNHLTRLSQALRQNEQLHDRVQQAAGNVALLNERFLRRIGAELHDGPAQDLGLILLRMDRVMDRVYETAQNTPTFSALHLEDLEVTQGAVQRALQDVRNISRGLSLPSLDYLSLTETITRAVKLHEQRSGSHVTLQLQPLPEDAPLPIKITAYRLVQESLHNTARHANSPVQIVSVTAPGCNVRIQITDQGCGFDVTQYTGWDEHLGLAGMRERVESLGGTFEVQSRPGFGTTITAELSW